MGKQPLRIACLHGFCQNSQSFRRKTGALRKSLSRPLRTVRTDVGLASSTSSDDDQPLAELVYLDAPFLLEEHLTPPPEDQPTSFCVRDDTYAVLRPLPVQTSSSSHAADKSKRIWWNAEKPGQLYRGCEDALVYLSNIFQQNKFDGLLAFSQGAIAASLICALHEKPEFASLRFAMLFSGFASRATVHQPLYDAPIKVPTLHVYGELDELIPQKASQDLLEKFDESARSVYVHNKGHLVPGDAASRRAIAQFVLRFADMENQDQRMATM